MGTCQGNQLVTGIDQQPFQSLVALLWSFGAAGQKRSLLIILSDYSLTFPTQSRGSHYIRLGLTLLVQ